MTKLTVKELKEVATKYGFQVVSKAKKEEIATSLLENLVPMKYELDLMFEEMDIKDDAFEIVADAKAEVDVDIEDILGREISDEDIAEWEKKMNKEEEVEMNKNITMVEDNIGANAKVVLDDIPTPINAGKPMTVANALMEALKHPAGTIIEVGTKEEIKAIEEKKIEVGMEEKREPKAEVGNAFIPGVYVLNLKTVVPYVLAKIEDNGLYKLLNSNNRPTWLRAEYIVREDLYRIISKEEAHKVMDNKGAVQSPAAKKDTKTVKTNNVVLSKEQIIEKAKVAGEYAKANFKYRIEQTNNFRQMFIVDNTTGEKIQVGVGATVAGRVMEYEASNGAKISIDRTGNGNKVAEDKAKYINTKRTKTLCVECQKEGKKHFITESEAKYLMDNQKFIPDEYKNKGLCYKHQATTGVKRAVIAGRRSDVTVGNTSLLK